MDRPRPKPAPAQKPASSLEIPSSLAGDEAVRLEERLAAALEAAGGKEFTLDLSPVTLIDSRGLSVCIGAQKECQKRGLTLRIKARPEIGSIFERLKLNRLINISPA